MTNKTTTLILGIMFLIFSVATDYYFNVLAYIICSSIFFSAHFIIKTLEKLNKNDKN